MKSSEKSIAQLGVPELSLNFHFKALTIVLQYSLVISYQTYFGFFYGILLNTFPVYFSLNLEIILLHLKFVVLATL